MSISAIDYVDLLGKPFKYGGRGPAEYDCYGLVLELHRRAGVQIPDYGSSDDPTKQGELFTIGTGEFKKIILPRPLDIPVFRVADGLWHCGVIVDGYKRFVHIMESCSVVVEELESPAWQNRLQGVYRWS